MDATVFCVRPIAEWIPPSVLNDDLRGGEAKLVGHDGKARGAGRGADGGFFSLRYPYNGPSEVTSYLLYARGRGHSIVQQIRHNLRLFWRRPHRISRTNVFDKDYFLWMQTFGCLATRYAKFRHEYQRIPDLPAGSGTAIRLEGSDVLTRAGAVPSELSVCVLTFTASRTYRSPFARVRNAEDPDEFGERQYCLVNWPINERDRAVIERGPVFKLSYKMKMCKAEMGVEQKLRYIANLVSSNGSALSIMDYFILRADALVRPPEEREKLFRWASAISTASSRPPSSRSGHAH